MSERFVLLDQLLQRVGQGLGCFLEEVVVRGERRRQDHEKADRDDPDHAAGRLDEVARVGVFIRLRADAGRCVRLEMGADARGDFQQLFAQVLRLPEIPAGESEPDAGVIDGEPFGRLFARVLQGFLQQIEEFLIPRQLVGSISEAVLVPLLGERERAFGDHGIDEELQRQLQFLELRLEAGIGHRLCPHLIEEALDLRACDGVIDIALLAPGPVQAAHVLEERLTEIK